MPAVDVLGFVVKTRLPLATVSTTLILPAEKSPAALRAIIVLAVLALVAVVAEFEIFPAVAIVANFVSAIAADADTSAFTIKEVDKLPETSV